MANVEVTGAARLYRAASVWTAGLYLCLICLVVADELVKVFDVFDELPHIGQEDALVEIWR
jgi:hypothetical protein